MNKKALTLTLGGAIASSLLSMSPAIQAGENPFAMSAVNTSQQLAAADEKMNEGGCSGKMKEGKCGEGKCGANKMKKMKMKEGGCSGAAKPEEKMKEGGCSGKMKEGGCSGKM
ncbi:MAG: hypothetical protein PSU93_12050 [Methylobacter sp.]|uniref:Low-complexity protein n=1 Tax=Candidatus Methylobacter titanis TaxID=3053457 RepID=A0AA43Q7D8_9GAMM|nr:hypothetical protein [Candidatus Methylobacter titanis]